MLGLGLCPNALEQSVKMKTHLITLCLILIRYKYYFFLFRLGGDDCVKLFPLGLVYVRGEDPGRDESGQSFVGHF